MEPTITLTSEEVGEILNREIINDMARLTHGLPRSERLINTAYALAFVIAINCDSTEASQLTLDSLINWMKDVIDNESIAENKPDYINVQ